jgi:hypothetical protein
VVNPFIDDEDDEDDDMDIDDNGFLKPIEADEDEEV